MNCNDCDIKYISQTRNATKTCFREQFGNLRYESGVGREGVRGLAKSCAAHHVLDYNHSIIDESSQLVRNVDHNRYLDAFEA